MTDFPSLPTKRIAVKLKSAAERKLRHGHPWIFEGSITKESDKPNSGDLAIIYDHKTNKLLALGLYDCESPIRIKIVQLSSAQINQDWFDDKLNKAYTIRTSLLETDTNSYRLLFGEADGLPGVICDIYAGHAVLKLYSAGWFPYLSLLCQAIRNTVNASSIVLRLNRNSQQKAQEIGLSDGQILFGNLQNEEVIFKEHGIQFSANLIHGHKTGFFLDHRANRKRVGKLANRKTVLDVFSYAGGFSVHALCGDAKRVVSTDISGPALELAKKNALLNSFSGTHETLKGDAFKVLEKLASEKESFDLVIIDPPSFAKQQSEIQGALEQYRRLASLGVRIVTTGGILVLASCSSRITADQFFSAIKRTLHEMEVSFKIIDTHGHDIDHPVIPSFSEGEYLKCVYIKIL